MSLFENLKTNSTVKKKVEPETHPVAVATVARLHLAKLNEKSISSVATDFELIDNVTVAMIVHLETADRFTFLSHGLGQTIWINDRRFHQLTPAIYADFYHRWKRPEALTAFKQKVEEIDSWAAKNMDVKQLWMAIKERDIIAGEKVSHFGR
ncbi:MAG: hypothetical protein HQK59_01830 [Deltaproteobacteria bacterium]|nr:hypothetical protein [Deltaproteobacteria bacterium]